MIPININLPVQIFTDMFTSGDFVESGGCFSSRRLLMTFRLFVDFIVPVVFGKHKNQQGEHCLVY